MTWHDKKKKDTSYKPALSVIIQMEYNVVAAVAPLDDLTPDDFLDWLIPADDLKLLRAAFPVAEEPSSRSIGTKDFQLYVEFERHKCLSPKELKNLKLQPSPKALACQRFVDVATEVHTDFNKLRKIVDYFNEETIAPGAARHYFPALQSLLPKSHPFFSVSGDRYREVAIPHGITELLREAPEIVAKGLVCPARESASTSMGLYVHGNSQCFHMFGGDL